MKKYDIPTADMTLAQKLEKIEVTYLHIYIILLYIGTINCYT